MKINILKNNKLISTIYPENNKFTIDEDIDLNCEFEIETTSETMRRENQELKKALSDAKSRISELHTRLFSNNEF